MNIDGGFVLNVRLFVEKFAEKFDHVLLSGLGRLSTIGDRDTSFDTGVVERSGLARIAVDKHPLLLFLEAAFARGDRLRELHRAHKGETSSAAVLAMNSHHFIRSSSQFEDNEGEQDHFPTVEALGRGEATLNRFAVNFGAGFIDDDDVSIPVTSRLFATHFTGDALAVLDGLPACRKLQSGVVADGNTVLHVKIVSSHLSSSKCRFSSPQTTAPRLDIAQEPGLPALRLPVRSKSGLLGISDISPMPQDIAKANIEHFKRLLETETDAEKRAVIERLLAEHKQKLAALKSRSDRKEG